MRFVLYTNSVSAHQLPLAREIVAKVGDDNFRYVYTGASLQGGGQEVSVADSWIMSMMKGEDREVAREWLDSADILLSGIRDVGLFERRSAKGLKTFYQSERWFKPIDLKIPLSTSSLHLCIPGCLRMLVPRYRKMANRFVRWTNADPNARFLAIGPWAKRDMLRLGVNSEKIVDWGYFVEEGQHGKPSTTTQTIKQSKQSNNSLRILWVGRPLWWKRVDTIRKAVAHVPNATLDVFTNISLAQVREEMRRHDIYVLASNELEGWGAALNEALEEGMTCLGTYEAGASAAMLPKENLFHAGDWKTLAMMLCEQTYMQTSMFLGYTAKGATAKLFGMINCGNY